MREVISSILEEHGPGTAKQVSRWIGGGVSVSSVAAVLNAMVERDELRRDLVDEGRSSYHLYSLANGRQDLRGRLCISRKVGESVVLDVDGEEVTIVLTELEPHRCKFSVIAPKSIRVFRDELLRGEL